MSSGMMAPAAQGSGASTLQDDRRIHAFKSSADGEHCVSCG
jgi:hypothetical protein